MKIELYNSAGERTGDINLNATIFDAKINPDLIQRAVVMRLANARTPIAHTKTRGDVMMTTAKAFRQKGTGRARRGAKSTSLLRGGGVTHGPSNNRNFSKAMPKKERKAALFSSLTIKAKGKEIFALESFTAKKPKTKDFVDLLTKLPKAKKYLFILSEKDEIFEKSVSNLSNVKVLLAAYLNPYDVIHAEKLCFLKDSFEKLEEVFLTEKNND